MATAPGMLVGMAMGTVMPVPVIVTIVVGMTIVDAEEMTAATLVRARRERHRQNRDQESGRNECCFHGCLLTLRGGRQTRTLAMNGR